ncbi:chorismate mutase [Tumebacillus lipolyticus]|uniref:Chorismate mutase n=1 Tax=Tumebacillus lipolyticus TaxID=1280370 RepID=A0ABW4ZXE1_9BACL
MIECKSIEEVRDCINRIDDQIVRLIAERSQYVSEAIKYKKLPQEVNVPRRNEEIIQRVRELSNHYGLDPIIAEGVYRSMIHEFVQFQMKELEKRI